MTYLFESLPNEITVSSARGVLGGGALNDKGGGAVAHCSGAWGRWGERRAVGDGEIVQTAVLPK